MAALNPSFPLTEATQSVWNASAGLPHNSVVALAQTSDGYLWVGTEEGLARFDGVKFTIFDTSNTPALRSNHISALLADSQNRLWIGTQGGGLTLFIDGGFKTYTTKNGLPSDSISCLLFDKVGSLWIGTSGGGLSRLKDGKFRNYSSHNGLPDDSIFSLAQSKNGSIWVGTHAGLATLTNSGVKVYTTKDGLPDNYVKCVYITRAGDVWVGTNEAGLNRLSGGHFTHYGTKQGVASNSIWTIYEDSRNVLWIGTPDAGLSRFSNGAFTLYSNRQGLPSNRVFAFLEDKQGDLWIATGGGGLVRLSNGIFSTLTIQQGLSNDVVLPVFQDRFGAIWAGTHGGGVNRIESGKVTAFTTRNGLADNVVFSLAEDVDGNIWISTRKGLDRLAHGKFTLFTQKDGLPGDVVLCLYRDREGTLWAGSRGGLSRFDGNHFQTYTTRDGLTSNYVVSLYEDLRHRLWIGTGGGGLDVFSAGHFTSYSTASGLSSNTIWSISGDPDGTLWIGTAGGGLDRLRGGKVNVYRVEDGLFDNELFSILADKRGYLWISSNKGVFRISKSDLNAFADHRLRSLNSLPYGTVDGLKTNECNGGFQPAGWLTEDGKLLFATMHGLAIADPERVLSNKFVPSVLLEKISIDGNGFGLKNSVEAQPGEGELEFTFTAPALSGADRIRFRYKLDGFDKAWVDAGQRRTAYYTNIPPGKYRFAVNAYSVDGAWTAPETSVEVSLLPHFYQTGVFLVSCVGFALAICFGFFRLRIRQIRRNEQRLMVLVDERTQALQEQILAKERANAELAQAQQSLIELSRRSGMAEVATGVLHNVGNVLNSVNVGASVVTSKLRDSRVDNLMQAVHMLETNSGNLSQFIESDPKGQRVLPYLGKLAHHLQSERAQVLKEMEGLTGHIDHIKEIVATQQDYARASALTERVSISKLVNQALAMVEASLSRHHVEVVVEVQDVPEIVAVKHKLVEILVNLIRNAKQAVIEQNGPLRQVRICVRNYREDRIRIEVNDTGVGLGPENLTRVFAHGFTTKRDGHGFGLHSGALSAKQMGGSLWAESDGPGLGATFILELPVTAEITDPVMSTACEI